MLITKLTIKKSVDHQKEEFIFDSFFEEYNVDLLEVALLKTSDCNQHDIMYTFFSKEMVDYLVNLFIESEISIVSREVCTNEIVNIIITNNVSNFKSEFDYTIGFDELIESFSKEEIIVNAILEKVSKEGKESLTDYQVYLLKNAA